MKNTQIKSKSERTVQILSISLFVLLGLSFIYAVVMLIIEGSDTEADYLLTASQSFMGLVVMLLPFVLRKKFKLDIPIYLQVILVVFVYLAIFCGEVRHYYYRFKYWDLLLHSFSGIIFGLLSFSIINLLNENRVMHLNLSPLFVALFAFCFAVTVGTVWEIYEFINDAVGGANMQKFIPEFPPFFNGGNSNLPLNGTDEEIAAFFRTPEGYKFALLDTMEDLIVDAIGALIVSIVGYVLLKRKSSRFEKLLIVRNSTAKTTEETVDNFDCADTSNIENTTENTDATQTTDDTGLPPKR